MKPVKQTITELGKGNCFSACLASIFELEIDQVPYDLSKNWNETYLHWLYDKFGLDYYYLSPKEAEGYLRGYSIASGPSPRFDNVTHAVVALDGKIVHDPHPDNTGIKKISGYYIFEADVLNYNNVYNLAGVNT